MDYVSSNKFIKKLESKNFQIGSFDVYLEKSKGLINSNLEYFKRIRKSFLSEDDVLKNLPTIYRASIVDKESNEYVGFISAYDVDNQNKKASLIFVSDNNLSNEQINEIIDEYKKFIYDDLAISTYEDISIISDKDYINEHNDIKTSVISFQSNYLKDNIDSKIIDKYKDMGYVVPNLSFIKEIVDGNRSIGIIGLSNLIWSNNRANLNVFFDKGVDDKYIEQLGPMVIDEYLDYIHQNKLHNVSIAVSGSDSKLLQAVENSNMDFYAAIPFASRTGNIVESNYLFQHYPNMNHESLLKPDNKMIIDDTPITELDDVMKLNNAFIAISPRLFEERNIDVQKIVKGHINALQHRPNFSIPLGEDKYMLQEGNGKYGISKAVLNYQYIIFDNNLDYCGIASILRRNGKNAEIEVGLKPTLQHQGLGKIITEEFYKQLFKHGYMSATSAVFDFNNPSNRLITKLANYNGTRIESYYINGKLWNMNFYTKTNENTTAYNK